MKQIKKDEIYNHLSEFLKGKGIELKEGTYTKGVHASCSMLADAINLSQAGLERAKTGFERRMDQVRQAIHEKTAPKPPPQPKAAKPQSTAHKTASSRKAGQGKGPSKASRRPR